MPRSPINPFDLTSPGFVADPYPVYARLRTELPACWDPRFRWWLVSRHADAQAVLRDPRWSSNHLDWYMSALPPPERAAAAPLRELLAGRLIHTDEPDHHRIRMPMQQPFNPREVESMRPAVAAIVARLCDRAADAMRMDVLADLAAPLASEVVTGMLGLPPGDRATFKAWTDDIYGFLGVSAVPIRDRARRATASAIRIRGYLSEQVEAARRERRDGLLGALVAVQERGDGLTETELISNVVGLLNASHETTANLIANTALALLRHPDQLARLADQPETLSAGAVEEGLRYESPIQMLVRRATEPVDVAGVTIPRGDHLVVLLGAANRDGAVFPNPDRFDVTRADNKHLAFGGGPHFCLGSALGRLQAQVAIRELFHRFPRLRLADGGIAWRPLPVFRGLTSLRVEWE